jgi:hypothetical protein
MADEEILMELEALKAIYMDDFKGLIFFYVQRFYTEKFHFTVILTSNSLQI